MMLRLPKSAFFAIAAMACGLAVAPLDLAQAQDATGTWLRENGASRVRFAACGSSLCGTVVWLKDPGLDKNNPDEAQRSRPLVGVRVFYDMKPNGDNKWAGKAYNPEDGKVYTGNMTLDGAKLTTQGCVLGGLICRSVNWTRVN